MLVSIKEMKALISVVVVGSTLCACAGTPSTTSTTSTAVGNAEPGAAVYDEPTTGTLIPKRRTSAKVIKGDLSSAGQAPNAEGTSQQTMP